MLDPKIMDRHLQMDMEMLENNTKILERAEALKAELEELKKAELDVVESSENLKRIAKLMDCAVEMNLFEEQFENYVKQVKEAIKLAVMKDKSEERRRDREVVEVEDSE